MQKRSTIYDFRAVLASIVMFLLVAGCASSERSAKTAGEDDPFNTVSSEEIKDSPSTNLHDLIVGKIPGVQVYEQAGGVAIRIRGTSSFMGGNEPLYILDGFPTEPGPGNVFQINPHDVKSIRILKGSDAATYGVRGANGVIIITTKRGVDN